MKRVLYDISFFGFKNIPPFDILNMLPSYKPSIRESLEHPT